MEINRTYLNLYLEGEAVIDFGAYVNADKDEYHSKGLDKLHAILDKLGFFRTIRPKGTCNYYHYESRDGWDPVDSLDELPKKGLRVIPIDAFFEEALSNSDSGYSIF